MGFFGGVHYFGKKADARAEAHFQREIARLESAVSTQLTIATLETLPAELRRITSKLTQAERLAELDRIEAYHKAHPGEVGWLDPEPMTKYLALMLPEDVPELLGKIQRELPQHYTSWPDGPLVSAFFQTWAESDPAGLETWIRANLGSPLAANGARRLGLALYKEGALKHWDRLLALGAVVGGESTYFTIQAAVAENPQVAYQKIQALPDLELRSYGINHVLVAMALNDPEGALKLAREQKEEGVAARAESRVVMAMIAKPGADFEKIGDYLLMEAGERTSQSIDYMFEAWSKVDPEQAAAWLKKHEPVLGPRFDVPDLLLQNELEGLPAREQFTRVMNRPEATRRLEVATRGLAKEDPAFLVVSLKDLPPEAVGKVVKAGFEIIAEYDPKFAMEATANIPVRDEQERASTLVMSKWLSLNKQSATRWIENQPPGQLRDDALGGATQVYLKGRTGESAAWAVQISDEKARAAALEKALGSWADKGAARSWLEAQNLPADEKAPLLRKLEVK